jgi:hypothetical protein
MELLRYFARSSWISQASSPWPEPLEGEDTLSGFGRRVVEEDLDKRIVDGLIGLQPDIVVIDLIDERFSLFRCASSWVTMSDYLGSTELGQRVRGTTAQRCDLTTPERLWLFEASVRALANRLLARLPRTRFVLHEALHATRVTSGSGFEAERLLASEQANAVHQQMWSALADAFGPNFIRLNPPEDLRVADPGHRWGLAPFHFVQGYYDWLLDCLEKISPPQHPGPMWFPEATCFAPGGPARPGGRESVQIVLEAAQRKAKRWLALG